MQNGKRALLWIVVLVNEADMNAWASISENTVTQRADLRNIEDLSDAVLGAGLEAVQLSNDPVSGSLTFTQFDGITCSSGHIQGKVLLDGALSEDQVTLGAGLAISPGARHWVHSEIQDGSAALFHPGDGHHALYEADNLYAVVSMPMELLEHLAAEDGVVIDKRALGGTRIDGDVLPRATTAMLRRGFMRLHTHDRVSPIEAKITAEMLLAAVIDHFGHDANHVRQPKSPSAQARVVSESLEFISANLEGPLTIGAIANAAGTSRRSLHRAFAELLGETPGTYIRKLRLNRIRRDIVSDTERAATITILSMQWGISELGRFSGWYREHFGELPSETMARYRHH
ncbi:helix-turn-helix transcriptional regulator [Sedimentitalea sp. HM32M-2]|uniref:helix-turn-helix transcriptional regulator n=1 Tax=Sedimentitalea sp. HM32M-2 TaxID=3351566 RepID=UPI00362996A0